MCDCYWPECQMCETRVPLHIADFCMPREDVAVFCSRHLPPMDVVVYELVSGAYQPDVYEDDAFYHDPPKGWRMGVRYLRPPPRSYGLQAAEPNTSSSYLAEYRTSADRRYFFSERSPRRHRSERAAIQATLRDIERRRERSGSDEQLLRDWLDRDRRIWSALRIQYELRSRIGEIAFSVPLVRDLRKSGNLIAVALIGSLRNRDFVPGLSDIDFWVIGKRLRPGLKVEHYSGDGQDLELNLVCRNPRFLRRMLREGNPVDLVAIRHGEAVYDEGLFDTLHRRAYRYRATPRTRNAWISSSARWLSMAVQQYFSPDCAHCFFSALYHAARDLLRAHLVGDGEDVTEGWEVEAAVAERWPGMAELYGRLLNARACWESFDFPIFVSRTLIDGELGELVLALEEIARPVYRSYGLRLPGFRSFFDELVRRRGARRFFSVYIHPDRRLILVGFEKAAGKHAFARRRIPRTSRPRRD